MQLTDNIHAFMWQSTTSNNCNSYLIDGPIRILVDPGHTSLFDHVRRGLAALDLALDDIGLVICTHAHPDHLEAAALFREKPALVTLHQRDWQFVKSIEKQVKSPLSINSKSIAPAFFLKEGDFTVGGRDFLVLHTPGHSPGSVSLYWPKEKVLFTGDLVFKGGLGRTDLPGGDGSLLKKSIKRLTDLEVEQVLPGHGDIINGTGAVKTNFEQLEQVWFNYI